MHIMDIVSNSVRAGASHIWISLKKDIEKGIMTLNIRDDGKGMDRKTLQLAQDPFFSTKKDHKIGLGIPLLKGTAETTGGSFFIESKEGIGTEVSVSLDLNHPDLPPMGNLKDTLLVLITTNPEVDFYIEYNEDGRDFVLDTAEIKNLLGGVPVNHPEVIRFLSKFLDENV